MEQQAEKQHQIENKSKNKLSASPVTPNIDPLQSKNDSGGQQSSFSLSEGESEGEESKEEAIQKALGRLGLQTNSQNKQKLDQLQIIVDNVVENWAGSVDSKMNLEHYEGIFKNQYLQTLKAKQLNCSIIVSPFTDVQKIRMMGNSGVNAVIKQIRLFLKKISSFCQVVIEHNLFQAIVLIVIILNTAKMVFDNPLTSDDDNITIETIFIVFYTLQMIIKVFALGLIRQKGSYLRDPWNILDFIIIVTSLLPYIVDFGFSVQSMRAIRVLRPLKTITKVRALKMIVSTLFHSFSLVMDSLYILIFVIVLFSVMGNQLFSGELKNRCIEVLTGNVTQDLCIHGSTCKEGFICGKSLQNPNFSIINFDTIFWSILTVFQTLTLEGWSGIMLELQMAFSPAAVLYSVAIVFFCEYVILNMTMAILKYKYSQVKGNTIQKEEQEVSQYEPSFLKRLGIFHYYTKLSLENPLQRYFSDDKVFVGSIYFNSQLYSQFEQGLKTNFMAPLASMKDVRRKSVQKNHMLEISKLQKGGKIPEYKWDTGTLQFDSIDFSAPILENINEKTKALIIQSDESISQNSQSVIQEENQSDSSFEQEDKEMNGEESDSQIQRKVLEMQRRLNPSKKNIYFNSDNNGHNSSKQFKSLKMVQKEEARNNQQNQMDQILEMAHDTMEKGDQSSKPPNTIHLSQISIPAIDFSSYKVNDLYEKFKDLGQNRVKRLEKDRPLNFFAINQKNKPFLKRELLAEKNMIKAIKQENSLDIKELNLVNELSKLKMKCRIKKKQQLDAQKIYDKKRVLIFEANKEKAQKQKLQQINIRNMVVNVKYKASSKLMEPEGTFEIQLRLFRNYESPSKGLKITQMRTIFERQLSNRNTSFKSITTKAVNFVKLLQNYKRSEKIQFNESKLMQMFFKEQKDEKKHDNDKKNQQEYAQIQRNDIFSHHGQIRVPCPCEVSLNVEEQFLSSINIQDEQYDIYIKGLLGIFTVIRQKTVLIIEKPLYDNSILLFVIGNTVILALTGMVDTNTVTFTNINLFFTIVFVIDLCLKIIAYGFGFFTDIMNIFDTFIVSISIVEASIGTVGANFSALRSIRILRAFRVLRLTRLLRSLKFMKVIMAVVSSVIAEFVYVLLLLLLFILIYTLLGMQLFGGRLLPEDYTEVRQNFDNFFNAFFSVFQVLTVQNWNDIETVLFVANQREIGIIYLVSWIFIGNWILMSLIQAILLDGFDEDSTPQGQEQEVSSTTMSSSVPETVTVTSTSDTMSTDETFTNKFQNKDASLLLFYPTSLVRIIAGKIVYSKIFERIIVFVICLSSIKLVVDSYIEPNTKLFSAFQKIDDVLNYIFIFECVLKIIAKGFILGQNAYLKDNWSILDFIIIITAIIDMSSTLDLAVLKLFRTLRPLRIISRNMEMKIIISSLAHSMCSIFNVLIIIICIFLMFGILGINLLEKKLYYCNLNGNEYQVNNYGPYNINMQQCLEQGGAWINQFVNFDNVYNSILSLYVLSTRQNWTYCTFTFIDSGDHGPQRDANQVLFMVFVVAVIFVCSYFFMDLLVGVLFLNFHAAEKKMRPEALTDKQVNWKNLQKLIIEEDPCFELYLQPENKFRKIFHYISTHKFFNYFITFSIIANIVLMMVQEDDESAKKTQVIKDINFAFHIIFITEMVIKLLAFGKAYFYSAWNILDFIVVLSSILDIVLQYIHLPESSSTALTVLPQIARILRVMRLTKVLRMFKRFKGLQKLIETFIFSIPALARGLSIVFLFLFIFSILATFLFENIVSDFSGNIDDHRNFKNFHLSLQTLFITTTGQNWYYYMYESVIPGYVTCAQGTKCVQTAYIIFWIAYIFLSQKVFMELFVLIVLDQFQSNYIRENNPLGIFALFEEDFRNNWIELTTKYKSQKIETKRLLQLILHLRKPLGLGKHELMSQYEEKLKQNERLTPEEIKEKLKEFEMKLKNNGARILQKMDIIRNRLYLGYHETFYYFTKFALQPDFLEGATDGQLDMLDEIQKQSELKLQEMMPKGANYDGEQEAAQNSDPLNPIELILFSQMIVKSWYNYSQKIHVKSKKKEDDEDSLNNSCSSEIAEAQIQKISQPKRASKRKGVLEGLKFQDGNFETKPLPDTQYYYKEKRKVKKKVSTSSRGKSIQSGLMSIGFSLAQGSISSNDRN